MLWEKVLTTDEMNVITSLCWIFQVAKLDNPDDIHDDDDIRVFHNYLSRTGSIAGNGKHAGNTVLLTSLIFILARVQTFG